MYDVGSQSSSSPRFESNLDKSVSLRRVFSVRSNDNRNQYDRSLTSYSDDEASGAGLRITYLTKLIGSQSKSIVTCICDDDVKDDPGFTFDGSAQQEYDFTLTHECCCPGRCGSTPPGPSGGGERERAEVLDRLGRLRSLAPFARAHVIPYRFFARKAYSTFHRN